MPSSGKVAVAASRESIGEVSTTQPPGGVGPRFVREARDSPPPPSDPRHEYRSGELLAGKYKLVRLIGEGGMGAVWLAQNLTLEVDVAVKLIRRERASPEAAQRLLQEARAAARLGHPSIVRVFDFGESQHHDPYIVMEVLQGESFRDLLARKKKLTPERSVRTLMPIAGALVSAHSRGIVHRDLKPDNIIMTADERGVVVPKIVDFGIAKLHQDVLDAVRVTLTGQIMGSPGYMSPEQLDGRADIDQRTDVWTFTVVLYEAMTGVRPFDGAHYNAMLSAILLRDPVPTTELGAGDDALWAILAKGLSKETKERWQSMREMGAALAQWGLDRGIQTDITGASLTAHWIHVSEGPQSDAPPVDHDVVFSIDEDPATDVSLPPELSPTERPPSSQISNLTPIPDTVPATAMLIDPSIPPPPALGGFAPRPSNPSLPALGSVFPAPRFGPPPKMPSYIPLPMEKASVLPMQTVSTLPNPEPSAVSIAPRRTFGGPLLWIAALAFMIGIGATWLIHRLSKPASGLSTDVSASATATAPLAGTTAPSSARPGSLAGVATSEAQGASSTSPAAGGTSTPALADTGLAPDGAGFPPGYVPVPGSTLFPRPLGPPYPSSSTGRPNGKPRSSAMPLPSAPNF